jgi:hypothetical protein
MTCNNNNQSVFDRFVVSVCLVAVVAFLTWGVASLWWKDQLNGVRVQHALLEVRLTRAEERSHYNYVAGVRRGLHAMGLATGCTNTVEMLWSVMSLEDSHFYRGQ